MDASEMTNLAALWVVYSNAGVVLDDSPSRTNEPSKKKRPIDFEPSSTEVVCGNISCGGFESFDGALDVNSNAPRLSHKSHDNFLRVDGEGRDGCAGTTYSMVTRCYFCDFYRGGCNSGYRGCKKKAGGIGDSDRDIPIDSSLSELLIPHS
ncbi:uncharacterized protein LACBIDRAFT_328969 [Laccaria bicolor S238N-H82]|uniref:Predicted protein n=1 Tax=Laccaria bicolor (strain S238N-H82 / ATCC MYA-4686) TaxID=486041 RepID=B0DGL8_LACBS|nr:uncharacterized protein LACBIDRAFT_328969 [Laccaria bicolor S238N-H82]EDR06293.1 predicted protein [Laccaria bicolor S238N-H82]|eukprot:XP_001883154.1 predicted protein [Laccaria bicolor S238N-H82]